MKDELGSAVENSLELIFETRGTIVEQAVIKVKARGDKDMYQSDTCTFGEKFPDLEQVSEMKPGC